MNKKNDKYFKLAAITVAMAANGYGSAWAVENNNEANKDVEVISVYGSLRQSLARAQGEKMEHSSVVESLSAEDIGKLPGSSIAESLATLPGLAGDRQNGRTSGISVRGFKEDFVGSTMNGRELLGIGFNRGVEFDLYPSEIMTGATVYKSPDASLTAFGVGGTIDLGTIRPLNVDSVVAVTGAFETNSLDSDNPDFDENGHRVSLKFIDKFANDSIGIALAIASTESPLNYQDAKTWGYSPAGANGDLWLGGYDVRAVSEVLERDTISAVLQYRVNKDLNITADALYIDFANEGVQRGFTEALPFVDANSIHTVENGLVTSGTSGPTHSTLIANPLINSGELTTFGVNATYILDDYWSLEFDAAHSKTEKNSGRVESYSGVGRSGLTTNAQGTVRDWELTSDGVMFTGTNIEFDDFDSVKLAGPQAWGGTLAPIQSINDAAATYAGPGNSSYENAQDGFLNEGILEEELTTFRLDFTRTFDDGVISAVDFGLRYTDRSKSKIDFGAYLTAPSFPYDDVVPEEYRIGSTDLSWLGLGNVIAYDARAMTDDNFYTMNTADRLETSRLAGTFDIEEQITTAFVKVDFYTELGDITLTGNTGFQVVDSEQSASGYSTIHGSDGFVVATPVSGGADYTDILPSLNLSFDFDDGHIVRMAASKVLSRPRFDYMSPGSAVSFAFREEAVTSTDIESGPWSGTSGNPELKPLEANQFDISYEWYFADDGYVSVGYFNKDLTNWHRNGRTRTDFSDFYVPGYHQAVNAVTNEVFAPVLFEGYTTFQEDGLKGSVDGFELTASIPFRLFSESLEGLGLIYSGSRSDGGLDGADGELPIPGMSDDVDQMTLYYENSGFSARLTGTKRSAYETEQRGPTGPESTSKRPIELWNAQISYDFDESDIDSLAGLSVSLNAINLTEEGDLAADSTDPRQISRTVNYGTTYILQMAYKF